MWPSRFLTREFHLIDSSDQIQREYSLAELREKSPGYSINCFICSRSIVMDKITHHLMDHLDQKYQIEKKRYQCCHCLQIFLNRYELELHQQSVSEMVISFHSFIHSFNYSNRFE